MQDLDQLFRGLCCDMHESWVRQKLSQGYRPGSRTDDSARVHKDIKPFSELTAESIDIELGVVRDVIALMEQRGYELVAKDQADSDGEIAIDEGRRAWLLDVLCRQVHESWRRVKEQQGYVYGPVTDDQLRTHRDLKNYDGCSDEKRALDVAVVGAILNGIESRSYLIVARQK